MLGKQWNNDTRVLDGPTLVSHGLCSRQRRGWVVFVVHSAEDEEAAAIAYCDGGRS